jgi:hypothetical protein
MLSARLQIPMQRSPQFGPILLRRDRVLKPRVDTDYIVGHRRSVRYREVRRMGARTGRVPETTGTNSQISSTIEIEIETCASKLDRLLSLGPLYQAIHDS